MFSSVKTCVLFGIEGNIVHVETDLQNGLPAVNIVGLPDVSIKESKERVRSAIKNSGFQFPLKRITINLAPANLRKEGSQLDLAIAVGILKSSNVIFEDIGNDTAILGELSLEGALYPIHGILPMVISLRELGIKKCIVPLQNYREASVVSDMEVVPVKSLKELVDYFNKETEIEKNDFEVEGDCSTEERSDFSDIKGQHALKRALEVAAAGGHNILIIGPPVREKRWRRCEFPEFCPSYLSKSPLK